MQKTDDVKTFNQIPDFYLETRSPRKRERERERERKKIIEKFKNDFCDSNVPNNFIVRQ